MVDIASATEAACPEEELPKYAADGERAESTAEQFSSVNEFHTSYASQYLSVVSRRISKLAIVYGWHSGRSITHHSHIQDLPRSWDH